MEQVTISDLGLIFFGQRLEVPEECFMRRQETLSGRGYLFVCDDEAVRDAAIDYLHMISKTSYLDFNAEPQGKKISEMCIKAYGTSYDSQKQNGYDVSVLSRSHIDGIALIVNNFQDIGLLAVREAKLALAFLRSLGRPPYNKTVVAVGSHESLDLIDHDRELKRGWAIYELLADSTEAQ